MNPTKINQTKEEIHSISLKETIGKFDFHRNDQERIGGMAQVIVKQADTIVKLKELIKSLCLSERNYL